ncbi:MAG: hypothetical protein E6J89_11560 [Deltaproteobacteria bacterium]|nr:MAG: hypothetical protein E6J89_11560 [Deltaproteobacteria bacterium]
MAGQILIALRDQDRLGEIIPYVKEIVQPGMRVVFLVRYPMDSWMWLRDHWIDAESPRKALLAVRGISENYSWERQKALAEKRILPACGALQGKGVNVSVDLYTGGLREVVSSYGLNGDVQLIIMQAKNPFRVVWFLRAAMQFFGLSRQPKSCPVLLLHANHESLF